MRTITFTNTIWSKSRYPCSTIVLIMRGVAQGTPTKHLAQELGIDRSHLLKRRHAIQKLALEKLPASPLSDAETEADEMYQNAGEKGYKHDDPPACADRDDPPRRRANKRRGLGTMENDRPPILGVVGRTSGQIRLTVCDNTQQTTIQPQMEADIVPTTTLYTDEHSAYWHIAETGRRHATVCHSQKEWARDDDGDGACLWQTGSGSSLQYDGRHLDWPAQLSPSFSRRSQEVPGTLRGNVYVGVQPQTNHTRFPSGVNGP
ncbi:MAG: transposase [Anaerolineae bacterium]